MAMSALSTHQPPPPRYFAQLGAAILANGYHPLPVRPCEKRTFVREWSRFCAMPPTAATVAGWAALPTNYGLALACGYACVAIDLDEDDPARLTQLYALALATFGPTPLVRCGSPPRCVLLYRPAMPGMPSRRLGIAVEVLGAGRYVVAFGIHPRATPYAWEGLGPQEVPAADLPVITAAMIEAFAQAVHSLCDRTGPNQDASVSAPPAPGQEAPPPGGPEQPSRTVPSASRWLLDADGRVCDGRDGYLAALVCRHFCHGVTDSQALADAAWSEFARTTSLERGKRDGTKAWAQADALAKAIAIVRKANRRPGVLRTSAPRPGYWTPARVETFRRLVDSHGAAGHLSPAMVRVSHAMAGFVRGDGTCFASPGTLARLAGCSERTAKAARRKLVGMALWHVSENRGGRARGADYAPRRDALEAPSSGDARTENGEQSAHPNIPVGLGVITTAPGGPSPNKKTTNKPGFSLGAWCDDGASPGYRAARRPCADRGVVEVPPRTLAIARNREGTR
jgi:hypothetical protein